MTIKIEKIQLSGRNTRKPIPLPSPFTGTKSWHIFYSNFLVISLISVFFFYFPINLSPYLCNSTHTVMTVITMRTVKRTFCSSTRVWLRDPLKDKALLIECIKKHGFFFVFNNKNFWYSTTNYCAAISALLFFFVPLFYHFAFVHWFLVGSLDSTSNVKMFIKTYFLQVNGEKDNSV